MANGESLYEAEKKGTPFAAMWGIPFGTKLLVTNIRNGKSVIITVTDRGPSQQLKNRIIDLSKKAFEEIADLKQGIITVKVETL